MTYGLHYVRDTGRSDSNLGSLPVLNQWGPGYGNQIRNPNLNFAPQLGFAWDVGGNGKTVVRGGGGLFYENSIWNNILFDSPSRLAKGNLRQHAGSVLGRRACDVCLAHHSRSGLLLREARPRLWIHRPVHRRSRIFVEESFRPLLRRFSR